MPEEKEKLEGAIEKIGDALTEVTNILQGWDGFDVDLEELSAKIQTLADHLDNRLRSLPKGTAAVQLSMKQAALLVQVLGNWANQADSAAEEIKGLSKSAEEELEKLGELETKFDEANTAFTEALENMQPSVPELNIESELKDAERNGP